ncbi:MAG: hypothetical protein HOZ81_37370 [Streptomyces sp.]|nr:hypothetical protein [Streptomyces sp.]NUT28664.1 hypothetical protein [Streptomyces sp.]
MFAFLTALPDSLLTSALHIVVGVVLVWLSAALRQSTRPAARTGATAGIPA